MAHWTNKYPKLGQVRKRPRNTSARCKCGKIAKQTVDIQWDYMRGNDDVVWTCDEHKNDLEFHTGGAKWERVNEN